MNFRAQSYFIASKKQILDQIPKVKIPNFAFRNNGKLQFDDVTGTWGLGASTFSNGAAYADLDNDGDMDLVMNNIDDEAMIYKNTSSEKDPNNSHYLHLNFRVDNLTGTGLVLGPIFIMTMGNTRFMKIHLSEDIYPLYKI